MNTSGRTARASVGSISGFGLASANTSGDGAMDISISLVSSPPAERPRKTSAPTMASASVRLSVGTATARRYDVATSGRPA